MDERLILYSSSECERCRLVKQMLDCHGVEYIDVQDNKELAIEKDIDQFPALEIGNKIIDDYGLVLIWLKEHGYYSLWGIDKNESN